MYTTNYAEQEQNITLRNIATHEMPTETLAPFIQTHANSRLPYVTQSLKDKPKGKLKSKH